MKLAELHEIILFLSFVIIQFAVKPVASNLAYENKFFVKTKQDSTRLQLASVYRNQKNNYASRYKRNVTTTRKNNNVNTMKKAQMISNLSFQGIGRNYSQDKAKINHNNNKAIPRETHIKKWQVGRVSRKQYEIINMLWRKTKIFADVEPTIANYHFKKNNDTRRKNRQPFTRPPPSRPSLTSTTPSYIEFYYLDETEDPVRESVNQKNIQTSTMRENLVRHHGSHKFVLSDSPMISFRINDPHDKPPVPLNTRYMQTTIKTKQRKGRNRDSSLPWFDYLNSIIPSRRSKQLNNSVTNATTSNVETSSNMITTTEYVDDIETCPATYGLPTVNDTVENKNISDDIVTVTQEQETTTVYDKIKFFELYDKHTMIPYYDEKGRLYDMDSVDIFIKGNELNNVERKVLLEHVDPNINNAQSKSHKVKHAKKSIVDNYKSQSNNYQSNQSNKSQVVQSETTVKPTKVNVTLAKRNVTKQPTIKLVQPSQTFRLQRYFNSKYVKWSDYPFAAVYVYEPSQVHCDAAGISPHWLITSGSCLSRHHKNPGGVGRSAFVTYCGVTWWNPERVAYVKYSVVHPRFHPREKTRRHLYNIGLVQVVTSMASACTFWSPVSLMSHQIVAEEEGTMAKAVGWGLDRFDTRYSTKDLPKSVLTSYENQVFSHSCPGNVGYDKAKRLDEEGGIKNVYCLALPPYSGEAADPIHGGLLLAGGKLVALYLQEERRPWGDQCAQYTGTWRLVPWILDVARENDDVDTFTLSI